MLPPKVCKEMDRINRKILWGNTTTKKKNSPPELAIYDKTKVIGGLGIKECSHKNKALLAKRLWDIRTNPNGLHASMLSKKGTRWLIRNKTSINFWHDNWTGSGPLHNYIQGPLNVCESALTVSEVWDRDRYWSLDKLSFVFPRSIFDTIHATPKSFQFDLADLPTWNL
ncbi:hypothetical protein CMV_000056 [Castanea mollissima]|uniref:Uncharacterized protein n=1 Tax=Castanea mollissima TaxID=60419 RepID=A0A8J4S1X1_9ROSI|nr:hypothetical protein CMV_000056 [Castanea mollissima]